MSNYYDLKAVNEMAGGDDDFVKVIVETFLEEIPPDVRSMTEAIDSNNPKLAYQYAHKMKPNLALFGLDLMEQILVIEAWSKGNTNIENAGNSGRKIADKVTLSEQELKKDYEL